MSDIIIICKIKLIVGYYLPTKKIKHAKNRFMAALNPTPGLDQGWGDYRTKVINYDYVRIP